MLQGWIRARSRRRVRVVVSVATVVMLVGVLTPVASASHFRFGSISWVKTSGNSVDFTLKGGFRRDGYSGTAGDGFLAVGDIFTENVGATGLDFGDASSTGVLDFKTTAINAPDNWALGDGLEPSSTTDTLISHTYSGPGPWLAFVGSCCTIGSLNNNATGAYVVGTGIDLSKDSESPISSVPPIVTVQEGGVRTWPVPALDSGGQTLRWRLATAAEACNGCSDPQPPGLAINPTTGAVTWDTTGVALGLWFTAVVIEALDGSGQPVSGIEVTYLVNVVPKGTTAAPEFVSPTPAEGTEYTVEVGQALSVALKATDADSGDSVHIDNLGLPSGASATGIDGNPATASFDWTPATGQVGDYLVTFTAQDDESPPLSAPTRTIVIHVVKPTNRDPDCSTVTPDAKLLWPPNHKFRVITLAGASDPDGDPVALSVTGVTQDEPLNGLGDGDTAPDAKAASASNTVAVRAERSGTRDGRVYRISFTGSDGKGGSCSGTVDVGVPHDQGRGATPVDSGQTVNSFGP